jgi:hypothetical protein
VRSVWSLVCSFVVASIATAPEIGERPHHASRSHCDVATANHAAGGESGIGGHASNRTTSTSMATSCEAPTMLRSTMYARRLVGMPGQQVARAAKHVRSTLFFL